MIHSHFLQRHLDDCLVPCDVKSLLVIPRLISRITKTNGHKCSYVHSLYLHVPHPGARMKQEGTQLAAHVSAAQTHTVRTKRNNSESDYKNKIQIHRLIVITWNEKISQYAIVFQFFYLFSHSKPYPDGGGPETLTCYQLVGRLLGSLKLCNDRGTFTSKHEK